MHNKLQDPNLVVSAIVEKDNKFLLVKRKNPPSQNMYAFPGGRLEDNESPEAGALRELQEETELLGENPKLYAVYQLGKTEKNYLLHVYKVDVKDTSGAVAKDDALDLGWYSPSEAKELPMPESMVDCFEKLSSE